MLIQCPDCHQSVSDEAPACPNCGKSLTAETKATGRRHASQLAWVWLGFAALVLLYLAASGAFRGPSAEREEAMRREDAEFAAIRTCHAAIRSRLAAPSTAKFPLDVTFWNPQATDTTSLVYGSLDAQNRFGAMLRQGYSCEVRPTGPTSWRVIDVTVDGK